MCTRGLRTILDIPSSPVSTASWRQGRISIQSNSYVCMQLTVSSSSSPQSFTGIDWDTTQHVTSISRRLFDGIWKVQVSVRFVISIHDTYGGGLLRLVGCNICRHRKMLSVQRIAQHEETSGLRLKLRGLSIVRGGDSCRLTIDTHWQCDSPVPLCVYAHDPELQVSKKIRDWNWTRLCNVNRAEYEDGYGRLGGGVHKPLSLRFCTPSSVSIRIIPL